MVIVIDANILFSALVTPNNRLANLLAHPKLLAKRISCHFLLAELYRHQPKIAKYAKKTEDAIAQDIHEYMKYIRLYDETLIQDVYWQEAERLTVGVDRYDMSYVALTLQTDGLLWTGDKKLSAHLTTMGFDKVVTTAKLFELLEVL